MRSLINGEGYTFTVLLDNDPQGEVNTLYDITLNYPTTFFIDAEGIIKKIKRVFLQPR